MTQVSPRRFRPRHLLALPLLALMPATLTKCKGTLDCSSIIGPPGAASGLPDGVGLWVWKHDNGWNWDEWFRECAKRGFPTPEKNDGTPTGNWPITIYVDAGNCTYFANEALAVPELWKIAEPIISAPLA